MYTFFIKDNGPDVDIIITRSMLALAGVAAMVYRSDEYFIVNLSASIILFIAAVFIKSLLVKFRINKFVLLLSAAVILFIATHSVTFAVILLVYGYLVKFFFKNATIEVANEGISIKKLFAGAPHQWNEFSNIILKDNLLTLDFKNNKLVQLSIDENKTVVDQDAFNEFCRSNI